MISEALKVKIEERFGKKLRYTSDLDALAQAIVDETKEPIGVSTLKRMFGFVSQTVTPRLSTMDIIAQYCGYPNYKLMSHDLGTDIEISDFTEVQEILSSQIEEGAMLQLTYDPGRVLVLTYIGDNYYIVNESQKSKLQKGDKLKITHLTKGFELVAGEVIREGKNLGSYTSAKQGGLTSIEIIG